MDNTIKQLQDKKQRLDSFQPLPTDLIKNLDQWFKVELTYTSNAIEGNTLSRQETALVVEKGITVEGKTVNEHLEATNHAEALDYIRTLVKTKRTDFSERETLNIHQLILQKIDNSNAGRYRNIPVRISGSTVKLPNALKVPELMTEFMDWLHTAAEHPIKIAIDAHYKFVSIHPFTDGNGRTARLLMNLLLMQEGYPPALIRKEDRKDYLNCLEKAQLGGSSDDYYRLMYEAVDRSLDIYLETLEQKEIPVET